MNVSSNTIEMNEVEDSETVPEVLTPLPHSPHDAEAAMENPLPESHSPKRFTFEVTKLPYLPDGFYISLRLNERQNGKMKKTKIISLGRDPQWSNRKSFSFDVHNTEDATVTCKLKKMAHLGF